MRSSLLILTLLLAVSALSAKWPRHIIDNSLRGADGARIGDINNDGRLDILTGWEESGITKLYFAPAPDRVRQPWPGVTIGKTPAVEDAIFFDCNQDGRLEILAACEGSCQTLFMHRTEYPENPAAVWEQKPVAESEQRMQWMFLTAADLAPTPGNELIAAGKNENAEIGWFTFERRDSLVVSWRPWQPVGWVMSIIPHDMDDDGDVDVVYSDRKGESSGCYWLENPGPQAVFSNWPKHLIGCRGREVMFIDLADINTDGRVDVLASVKSQELHLLRQSPLGEWHNEVVPFPDNTGTAKSVRVGDINLDQQPDLVFSCEHADSSKSGVMWLQNIDGSWLARDISGPEGIKFDLVQLLDIDDDGDLDVLTCEERRQNRGLGLIWYENPARP